MSRLTTAVCSPGCILFHYSLTIAAIAVDDDGSPVGSILEAAHLAGFKTGLIATSRITHATPACYSSHVLSRGSENEIAAQQIGYSHPFGGPFVDVVMGGGRRHYLPKAAGGRRSDDVDLIEWAKEQGYTYAADKPDFQDAITEGKLSLPFLGLFASSHMSYELDRDVENQASLLEMTKAAVESLQHASKDAEHGYFIMIEASRIDHAGHANDAAGHIHDTLMYNEVMAYLKDHVNANPDTQLLSAADHECGGLTIPDGWDPRPLAEPQSTTEHLTGLFASYDGDDAKGYLKSEILPQYGLADLSDAKVDALLATYNNKGAGAFQVAMGHESAEKAGVNWSSEKHSSVDVALYGHAVGKAVAGMKKLIGGNRNNNELPLYLEKVLGVSLANATAKLKEKGMDWIQKREDLEIIKHEAQVAAKMHSHGDM